MAHSTNVRRVLNSRCQWGSVPNNLAMEEMTFKHEKEKADYTTMESLGYNESATAVQKVSGSCKGSWNAGVNMVDSPPAIFPQDNGGAFKGFLSVADGTFYLFPIVTLPSTNVNCAMSAKLVKCDWEYESNGSFATPTGSFGQING